MSKRSIKDRFLSHVHYEPNSGCWLWGGNWNAYGYGLFKLDYKNRLAHRFYYQWIRGVIPVEFDLDHLCRVRCCVNPDHLEVVSRRENLLRGKTLANTNSLKTHCLRGHLFDKRNTHTPVGTHKRKCRKCDLVRKGYGVE